MCVNLLRLPHDHLWFPQKFISAPRPMCELTTEWPRWLFGPAVLEIRFRNANVGMHYKYNFANCVNRGRRQNVYGLYSYVFGCNSPSRLSISVILYSTDT